MNPERARAILRAWREDAPSVETADLQAALQQSREDPGLQAWLSEQRETDARVRAALARVDPPASLEREILAQLEENAGRPADSADGPLAFPPSARSRRPFWRSPSILSLAASVLVLVGIGLFVLDPNPLEAQPRLSEFFAEAHSQADLSSDAGPAKGGTAVQSWTQAQSVLHDQGYPSPAGMPREIARAIPFYVRTLEWRDSPVGVTLVDHPERGRAVLLSIEAEIFANPHDLQGEFLRTSEDGTPLVAWVADGKVHTIVFPQFSQAPPTDGSQ